MGSGTILHQAYQKYGKKNFTKTILAIAGIKENINILEKVFIQLYREQGKAEYNIADGGNGGNLGNVVNEKIRNSIILLYENNPDIKIKISDKSKLRVGDKNPFYGHKHSLDLMDYCTKPWFVLNTTSLLDQLVAFKKKREHFAVIDNKSVEP